MQELVYPREKTLGLITLVLGLLLWVILIVGTVGIALGALALGFLIYLFAQSTLISYIKGNGVELSAEQFPDLHAQFIACCERLQISTPPQAYVLNGGGALNAFATKFLGVPYIVLLSDVVDAMAQHPDGVRFYIGHELGHLRMKHLNGHLWRWPVLWVPLLGAAYSRARESTCDRHGLACSSSREGAVQALAALSAGPGRWQRLDIAAYLRQARHTSGFWMSFHELTGGYPWLTKRAMRLMDPDGPVPRRNPFAYLLAIFTPYAGRLGGGFGLLILVYVIGTLAAVALPAYHDYTGRAAVAQAISLVEPLQVTLGNRYEKTQEVPASLAAAGLPTALADGTPLELDPETMRLTATLSQGDLVFIPGLDEHGRVSWTCTNGYTLAPKLLPSSCEADAGESEATQRMTHKDDLPRDSEEEMESDDEDMGADGVKEEQAPAASAKP